MKPPLHVVIPSNSCARVIACAGALHGRAPSLHGRILVVDDGAREDLEDRMDIIRWVDGKKPFIFARNVNLGIQAAGGDVILLNDDAILETRGGFDFLEEAVRRRPSLGIVSAAVRGWVGNPSQRPQEGRGLRLEARKLTFVCVYITRELIDRVGPLDERFTGYGFDDDDYCLRARMEGFELAVHDGCVVEHGRHPSAFRSRADWKELLAENQDLFERKWSVAHSVIDRGFSTLEADGAMPNGSRVRENGAIGTVRGSLGPIRNRNRAPFPYGYFVEWDGQVGETALVADTRLHPA